MKHYCFLCRKVNKRTKSCYCSVGCSAIVYGETHRQAARKYQRKQLKIGRCITCGAKRKRYAHHCDYHGLLNRLRMRKRNHGKPWGARGYGRHPLIPDSEFLRLEREFKHERKRSKGPENR